MGSPRLPGDSRAQWTEDLSPFGGPDNRGPYSVPGTIVAANGEIFGIPGGQDGRSLTASDLIPGQANLTDRRRTIDILPRQTTHSVYGALDQSLSDHVSLYARALYARRAFAANSDLSSLTPYTVPTSNPFYVDPLGTGQPVSFDYDFAPELGHPMIRGHLRAITTSGGLQGHWGGWSIDLNGAFGHQSTRDTQSNSISGRRVAMALADTDPATALNLFGDGTGNNPATLDFIRSTYRDFSRSTVWSTALRIDGPLFELPAGTVKLAAGAEHRHEQFSGGYYYDSTEATPGTFDLLQAPGTPGQRHIDAVYAEVSIPVISVPDGAFPGKLDISGAGRADWYSDVGRTVNPKAGISWAVVPWLTLRGSWGTSFRAPTFYENAGAADNLLYPYPAPDPHSPTGTTGVILITGYSPTIKPERATTWTAGFDLKQRMVPGLVLTATYFDIDYRDRIATPAQNVSQFLAEPDVYGSLIETPTPAEVAALYASPALANYYGIPASDIRYIFHTETQNLSRTHVRGVDFTLSYTRPLLAGTMALDVSGTRLIAMDQQLTGTAPATDILGTIFNPVRWRARGHFGWARAGFSADAFLNYTGGYRNTLVAPAEHVGSWNTLDGQIGYRFPSASPLKGARIALSATNLFDKRPPYVNYQLYNVTFGYDPNQASLIGRQLSIGLTFQW